MRTRQSPLPEHQAHRRKMHQQPDLRGHRLQIIDKTDQCNRCQPSHKPRVHKSRGNKPHQCSQIKNNSPTPQSDPAMRTPLIWSVNDIIPIRNLKIKQFKCK